MAYLDDQFISIAGQPILIDADGELCQFLDKWFDPRMLDVVFQTRTRIGMDASYYEGSAYQDFLPQLPDLRINQYQIPTGLSRYSRGLFLVDKISLGKIASAAFKSQPIPEGDYSVLVDTYPALFSEDADVSIFWGVKTAAVELWFRMEHEYTESVYCLRPILVPYASRDLWLLPVVDYRYKSQFVIDSKDDQFREEYPANCKWSDYFEWALPKVTAFSQRQPVVGTEFGNPDRSVVNSRQPLVSILDAMGVTVGYRYVPRYGFMDSPNAANARNVQKSSDLIVAGGMSGKCDIPKSITLYGNKVRDWFGGYDWHRGTKANAQHTSATSENGFPDVHEYKVDVGGEEGNPVSIRSIWNVNIPTGEGSSIPTSSKFETFALYFVQKWLPFVQQSLDVTYAGIPKLIQDAGGPDDTYFLGAYDNWAIIDMGYGPKGQDRLTTRVQSMPNSWTPKMLVAQDPLDVTHYGPAFFITEQNVPKAVQVGDEWVLGQRRGYFMYVRPEAPTGGKWKVKKTDVYANVHNSLGSTEAKADWPMQCKFIDGIWMIDVAECV